VTADSYFDLRNIEQVLILPRKMHPKPQHWFLLHQLNCNKTHEISSMQVSKGEASYGMVNHHIVWECKLAAAIQVFIFGF